MTERQRFVLTSLCNGLLVLATTQIMSSTLWAQEAAAAKQPSWFDILILPIGFLFIAYFLMIRPQQKKMKEQDELMQSLKAGDEVVSSGGMIGRIRSVSEEFVTLDIGAGGQGVKILKSHISGHTKKQPATASKPAKSDKS